VGRLSTGGGRTASAEQEKTCGYSIGRHGIASAEQEKTCSSKHGRGKFFHTIRVMSLAGEIGYGDKYTDTLYEYRVVRLPPHLIKQLPKKNGEPRLMTEIEWRTLGIMQSKGWVHYMIYKPETHSIVFRRELSSPFATKATDRKRTPP
jgi:cyclin-dependent kinase regulatory subunit CKS1